ncbi:chromogranin-A isoform X2 [Poeciliopsis prolifica]|uniref:chromogranin-A isoform X2 n=1 Tax=Poeciliopsis prolifica TaxID=188132 RepID=UPI0024137785|nr:chromogranin-A isoform X2 [Poeciliopsis prolifica]
MTGRGLLLLAALSTCVLSLPVTSHQLENEDVEVMKCIVEALADVLSRPKQVPVSQECLNTLKTDERLLTILRHHNFLKELQEIATQGDHERGQLHKNKEKPTTGTQVLQTTADGSGDRSTKREDPKQKTAGTETEERSDKRPEVFSQKHDGKEETEEQTAVKRGSRESLSHLTQRARKWQQKKKAGGEEEPRLGSRQDLSHHSKEEAVEEKQKKKRDPERTPEERELQMIARRSPEERKVMEEEGSGTRKSEEPEIESLAAIESELENVAQKLHELRRG